MESNWKLESEFNLHFDRKVEEVFWIFTFVQNFPIVSVARLLYKTVEQDQSVVIIPKTLRQHNQDIQDLLKVKIIMQLITWKFSNKQSLNFAGSNTNKWQVEKC